MVNRQTSIMREEDRHVNVVLRTIEILECFGPKKPELTLTELSTLTGLQKSRLLRLCGTLLSKGYLLRDAETLKYSLGPRLMVLGRLYENANPLSGFARPILKRLAEETQETASLFTVYADRRLCLVKEDGAHPIRYVNVEGDLLDLHRGAGGRVLLTFMDEGKREEILERLIEEEDTTLTKENVGALLADFQKIRREGYAIGYGDVIPDVGAIAAPVFDHRGTCCASIAIAGPVHRFSADLRPTMVQEILNAAAEMSVRLGYNPDDEAFGP
jgi:DNA-binding IclR family transcriptional regulator